MCITDTAWEIFNQSIVDYHEKDNVDAEVNNPFNNGTLERILYAKNWIDTVQWHLEDIVRDTNIEPIEALKIKRRTDSSNQLRPDMDENG